MRKMIRSFAVAAALLFTMQAKAVIFDNAILGPIRSEITNQMVINSNTVPFNKPLATALRSALTTIDRPGKTNIAGDVKILSSLQTALKKTVLSNLFNAQIDAALDQYIAIITTATANSSNRLNITFPSGPRTAAQNNLVQVLSNLNSSRNLADLAAALRALSTAITKLAVTEALVIKAEHAPAPKASVEATLRITNGPGGHKMKSIGAAIQFYPHIPFDPNNPSGNFLINGVGLGLGAGQVAFAVYNLHPGVNSVAVPEGEYARLSFKDPLVFVRANNGSATVTWNPANKTIFGSFTFDCREQDGNRTGNVTGTFFGTYQ